MAVQMCDSFDHYTTILKKNNSVTSAQSLSAAVIGAYGRNSTNGLRLITSQSGAGASAAHIAVYRTMPTALATGWYAFAFETAALPSMSTVPGGRTIFALTDGGTVQLALKLLPDGTIQVVRVFQFSTLLGTSVVLGTTSFSLLANVYYHLELKAVINTGTSGSFILRRNGSAGDELNVTGVNTRVTANNSVSGIVFCHAPTQSLSVYGGAETAGSYNYYDDCVVRNDIWTGDKQVKTLLTIGEGDTDQWPATGAATGHEALDDTDPDDDTSYISTTTLNDLALYQFNSIAAGSIVDAVVSYMYAKKQDAGAASIARAIKSGGTVYIGSDVNPSIASYSYLPQTGYIDSVDPATGVAWTAAGVNAAQYGTKRTV